MTSFLYFKLLSCYPHLSHYISTRNGGFSNAPYDTFNLSTQLKDNEKSVYKNRTLVASHLQVDNVKSFFPQQSHSSNIAIVDDKTIPEDLQNTDALITATPNIATSVLAADCVPVLLYDLKKQIIAVIHAGWKGTVAKIVEKTLLKMQDQFGSLSGDILAGIGPSISKDQFEVGEEVAQKFRDLYKNHSNIVYHIPNSNKANIDLWEANKIQLMEVGIPNNQIEVSGICTFSNPELFFSARRDGFETGRFAIGAALKS